MPMIPMSVDSSTVAITSTITAAITFFFATIVGGIKPAPALVIAVVAGVVLYSFGVIPIGLLLVAGVVMIGAIFNTVNNDSPSTLSNSESTRRSSLGYIDNQPQQNANEAFGNDYAASHIHDKKKSGALSPQPSAQKRVLDESFERLCIDKPDLALRQLLGELYDEFWASAKESGLSDEDCNQVTNMKVLLWRYDTDPAVNSMPHEEKTQVVKWESSPFNILTKGTGKLALIEYMVWKEYPAKANMKLVTAAINNLVSHLEKNNGNDLLDGFRKAPFFAWLPWKKFIS